MLPNTVVRLTVDCHVVTAGVTADLIFQPALVLSGVVLVDSEDGDSARVDDDAIGIIQRFPMLKPMDAVCFPRTRCAREARGAVPSDERKWRGSDFRA